MLKQHGCDAAHAAHEVSLLSRQSLPACMLFSAATVMPELGVGSSPRKQGSEVAAVESMVFTACSLM